ncbi:MAG: hypothetical protein COA62_09425 [Rhodobiaceae bacterium]|nr:MAG: hypothetical protein COA62_09425 [Rhodobiaceae bacterium]
MGKKITTLLGGLRRHFRLVLTGVAVTGLAYAVGFFWFLNKIPDTSSPPPPQTDAIVVLTGGAERIETALQLLSSGNGKRLLISGVHPGVTRDALKDLVSADTTLFDCCVDVDWRAESTIGNAAEAAAWADTNGFQSLTVVTSAYHLPRALQELTHAMPEVTLTGYPVFHDAVRLDEWWLYQGTTRLLISEYSKFLLTVVRLGGLEEA